MQVKLLTVKEVAPLLRISPKALRRRILRNQVLATKPAGSKGWLIPASEVQRLLDRGANQ